MNDNMNNNQFGNEENQPVQNGSAENSANGYTSSGNYYANQQRATYSYTPNTNNYGYGSNGSSGQNPEPPKNNGRTVGIGTFILCIVLSVVISVATALAVAFKLTGQDIGLTQSENSDITSSSGTNNDSSSTTSTVITIEGNVESLVEAVYDKAGRSVVGIRTTQWVEGFFGGSESTAGEGSGVVYTADGYIITNYHVIEAAIKSQKTSIEVFFPESPETPVDGKVVGYNASADLAVIKVNKTGLSPVEIGNSDEIKVGQYAVAIGCPGGIEFLGSVSYGIISGLNRKVTIDSIGTMELIQTDAAINPGNSGGALLNSSGQLIGINSSKLVDESFEGMGFAIPVNTVISVTNKIIDNKDNPSPYIGIDIYKYDSKYLEKYSLPHGAAVKSVISGGPAAEAGIRAGDIITEFNKVTIDEYTDFVEALSKCTPGSKVTAKIYRNGRYYSTTVIIGSNNSHS